MIVIPLQSWAQLAEEAGDISSFSALPQADYDLRVIAAEAKNTAGGKTMFKITTEVTSGPYVKRRVWANLVVSPENPVALNIFFRQMSAIGIDKSFFATNPSDHNVAEALVGKEFRGQVVIKQYQGEDRNEIKQYSRLSRTESSTVAAPNAVPAPSPTSAPPAPAGLAPAPAPAPAPAAATVAVEKTVEADTAAVPAVTQPETPAVPDAAPASNTPNAPF